MKTTSFFSTVESSKSSKSQSLYLTMEDLDQRSGRNFRLSSQFVSGLLGVDLLFMMLVFTFQRHTLARESLACKASNIALTYLIFFLCACYMSLTVRNLRVFAGVKDFKNVLLVRSKQFVVGAFALISGLTCLLGQTNTILCDEVRFPVFTTCLVVLFSQTLVLLANLRISNEIRKDCEFSIAMESEESGTVSAKGEQPKYNEKFEGSFCIYQSSTRNRRGKWRGRRRRKRQAKNPPEYREWEGRSTRVSGKKPTLINNNDIFENDDPEEQVEKVIQLKPRRPKYLRRRRHEIRGIRISFGPKTHSQDSISTQTSNSPDHSRDSGLNEFDLRPMEPPFDTSLEHTATGSDPKPGHGNDAPLDSANQTNVYSTDKKATPPDALEKDASSNDCSSLSSDSFADLEEFNVEIDQNFKAEARGGFSFYKTPTKRLDEQFRKVCLSDKKQVSHW